MEKKMKRSVLRLLDRVRVVGASSLLVFESSTGFVLYGALFHVSRTGDLERVADGESRKADFSAAIADVLAQIKVKLPPKQKLPRKTVLLTPSAVCSRIMLPVSPEKPKPADQMRELVRWEIEEFFVRQNNIWLIGGLLMGRGYINVEQRQEVSACAAEVRFGATACEYGYCTREEVEESLALQSKLLLFDDDLTVGWAEKFQSKDGEGKTGMFPWSGIGLGDTIRDRWLNAFLENDLGLHWIYPQLGPSVALIPDEETHWLLVDIRQEQFVVMTGKSDTVSMMQVNFLRDGMIDADGIAEICRKIMGSEERRVYLNVPEPFYENLSAGMAERLMCEVLQLSLSQPAVTPGGIPNHVMNSMAGAALHELGEYSGDGVIRISAKPQRPPVWKRRDMYLPAALVLLGVLVLFVEASNWYRVWQYEAEYTDIEPAYREMLKRKNELKSVAADMETLLAEFNQKKTELARLQPLLLNRRSIEMYGGTIKALLPEIAGAVSNTVLLDKIAGKREDMSFELVGFSLTENGFVGFVSSLNQIMNTFNYHVADATRERSMGAAGIAGYSYTIRLEPL